MKGLTRHIFVRGNSPEEIALEVSRLKQTGQLPDGALVIEEALEPGERVFSVLSFDMGTLLREIDGQSRGLKPRPENQKMPRGRLTIP